MLGHPSLRDQGRICKHAGSVLLQLMEERSSGNSDPPFWVLLSQKQLDKWRRIDNWRDYRMRSRVPVRTEGQLATPALETRPGVTQERTPAFRVLGPGPEAARARSIADSYWQRMPPRPQPPADRVMQPQGSSGDPPAPAEEPSEGTSISSDTRRRDLARVAASLARINERDAQRSRRMEELRNEASGPAPLALTDGTVTETVPRDDVLKDYDQSADNALRLM